MTQHNSATKMPTMAMIDSVDSFSGAIAFPSCVGDVVGNVCAWLMNMSKTNKVWRLYMSDAVCMV